MPNHPAAPAARADLDRDLESFAESLCHMRSARVPRRRPPQR
jgi:hypothetical protein